MALLGGTNGTSVLGDIHVLDTASMTWRVPQPPGMDLGSEQLQRASGTRDSAAASRKLEAAAESAPPPEPRHGHTMDAVDCLGGDRQGSLAVVIGGEGEVGTHAYYSLRHYDANLLKNQRIRMRLMIWLAIRQNAVQIRQS